MSKNIVLCLDGTGNQFKEDNSNVVNLSRVLIKNPKTQIVYYNPGVGTLADPAYKTPILKKLSKIAGLAFGYGIIKDIEEAYIFLMNNYEEGDRIYIFGFSRGAYTARSLAGLIHCCGLLEKGNNSLLPYAINLFNSRKIDFKVLAKFKHTFGRICEIELLGLWDSVSSIGWVYSPTFFPFTINNRSVKAVRHALSIDEKRILFSPLHWGDKYRSQQNIKEVWFSGVHSDVGGGYPESESGLAKIALQWMIEEVSGSDFSVLIDENKYNRYVLGKGNSKEYINPSIEADSHNSLKGLWKVIQFIPLSVWNKNTRSTHLEIVSTERLIKKGSTIHSSVLDRYESHGYNARNINFDDIDQYVIEE